MWLELAASRPGLLAASEPAGVLCGLAASLESQTLRFPPEAARLWVTKKKSVPTANVTQSAGPASRTRVTPGATRPCPATPSTETEHADSHRVPSGLWCYSQSEGWLSAAPAGAGSPRSRGAFTPPSCLWQSSWPVQLSFPTCESLPTSTGTLDF